MTTTPVMVRTSERTQFTKCRQHWWWAYKERRKPIGYFSQPLVFGDMIHRALAAYYIPETRSKRRRGPHPAETFEKLYYAYGRTFRVPQDKEEDWADACELGVEMMDNYIERWKGDDKRILVLYPEMPFQMPIYGNDGKFLCQYVGTTDCLIRDLATGDYGLFEHKTAASISTSHLFMDEQANTYWALIPEWLRDNDIMPKGAEFTFMLYNFMRKRMEDDRPKNAQGQYLNKPTKPALVAKLTELGTGDWKKSMKVDELSAVLRMHHVNPDMLGAVSKSQPPPPFERMMVRRGLTERQKTLERIKQQVTEMNLVRAGKMPHYKSPSRECSFCEFKDICELEELNDDWTEMKKFTTERWEPYRDHVWDLDVS